MQAVQLRGGMTGISSYDDRSLLYYARPVYYRPYPYAVPVPFFLGFGFVPRW